MGCRSAAGGYIPDLGGALHMSRFHEMHRRAIWVLPALLALVLTPSLPGALPISAEAGSIPHPPPRALAQLQQQPAAGADDSAQTAPQGAEQRVALVIGNSNY